jgi:triacylglycerol lipase
MPGPFSPGYDNVIALKLASACKLAYTQLEDPAQFVPPPGYQIQAQFDADVLGNHEPIGFLMSSNTDAILAFRGTADFPDAIADIRAIQVEYPYDGSAGMSHAGFTGIYQSAREAVKAAVAALPQGLILYVTGHSLGGALAVLATQDIAVNAAFHAPIMYTLAGPRVGDPDFANRFDNVVVTKNTSSWRIVNMFDLVPLLPPERIFDPLKLKTYFYQHVADVLLIGFLKGGAIENHSLDNYIEALQ